MHDAHPTPFETLRRAAALMRERAEQVWPEPWHAAEFVGDDIQHFAAWRPSVALALADWLDDVAEGCEHNGRCAAFGAERIARAYLGGRA